MNAPASGFGVNYRLNRIKLVSRIAKYVSYAVLAYSMVFSLFMPRLFINGGRGPSFLKNDTFAILLMAAVQAGLWFWYQKLVRLPRFHDRTRLVLYAMVVQFWLVVGYWKMLELSPFSDQAWRALLMTMLQIVIWTWYWKLSRLFLFFEQGQIFTAGTIRCLKTLGLLCVIGWLLYSTLHYLPNHETYPQATAFPAPVVAGNPQTGSSHSAVEGYPPPNFTTPLRVVTLDAKGQFVELDSNSAARFPPHPILVGVSHRIYQAGFFSFDFGTGINFGLLFTGITIVLVAWIMEEGRKIQEEQALTV